jgi:uncharacterized protein
MKPLRSLLLGLAAALVASCLSGCLDLKPVRSNSRHLVLSTLPPPDAQAAAPAFSLGLGPVKLPGYLFRIPMAMRKGPTEIEFLHDALWAERLDTGCQRVLAANFSTLFPGAQVQLNSWRTQEVRCAIYVEVQQMDVDTVGKATLLAHWRGLAPAGTLLKAGESRLSKQAASPAADPAAAAAALSDLLADLSKEIAGAITAATR